MEGTDLLDTLAIGSADTLQTRDGFVAEKLREAILQGHLKPGDRLDQNEIAGLLNVSRSPVREALRTLATEGLVEIQPHRSAVVAELSPTELEEIYFIRGILEGMAARVSVPKITQKQLERLAEILEEMETESDLDRWLELNRSFHETIYEAGDRPRLLSIIENLRNTSTPYIRQYIASSEHMETARESHKRIYAACVARDGARAQEATEKHLKAVCNNVLVYVTEGKRPGS